MTKEQMINELKQGLLHVYIEDYKDYDVLEELFNVKLDRDVDFFYDSLIDKLDYKDTVEEAAFITSTDLLDVFGIKKIIDFNEENGYCVKYLRANNK